MAFKNIFSSTYAIVENTNYNGPRKELSFDLVLYRDSSKMFETGRMQYRVEGGAETFEIDSVITKIPAGLEHEAMPDDFDFDVFDTFKQYLVGEDPTADEFTAAGSGELKTGLMYLCEHKPEPNDTDGSWPFKLEEQTVTVPNERYDDSIPEGTEGADDWNPKTVETIQQVKVYQKIKYDWSCLARRQDYIFVDKNDDMWTVTGDTGSIKVQQVSDPFLSTDWATWFSASAMDKLNKNLSERIYSWLKTKPEYKDAVSI
jgi:hypothetical protein